MSVAAICGCTHALVDVLFDALVLLDRLLLVRIPSVQVGNHAQAEGILRNERRSACRAYLVGVEQPSRRFGDDEAAEREERAEDALTGQR